MRWEWIRSNPADAAKKPKQRAPQPKPPSAREAARIIAAAWEQDDDWGALVWLVMVTGMRRGEVLALRWSDVDLKAGMLAIRRNYVRSPRTEDREGHQDPPDAPDLARCRDRGGPGRSPCPARAAGVRRRRRAVESGVRVLLPADCRDAPADPSAVTHRYGRMCAALGIDSHLHALRHYSATELLTAGVDLRTVAGRLGHGGGGATTLRVYAAWVGESDRRAAELLGSRMKRPPRE